jgi:2,3-bisphosphoglycerate-dependent phosphoglycerate mutase
MQFYFIRHGQSANNLLWDQTGSSVGRSDDAELTEVGQRQVQLLARFLSRSESAPDADRPDPHNRAGFGLTHLYTSLMSRAVGTALAIAQATGLPPVVWQDAHEAGGVYFEDPETGKCTGLPGKPSSYFQTRYPRLVLPAGLDENGWWNRPHETPAERPLRAQRFLRELIERHGAGHDRVALVSHGAFYNYLMAALLKMPERDHVWLLMHNAAITRLDFDGEHWGVVYTNRVDFLPTELIS